MAHCEDDGHWCPDCHRETRPSEVRSKALLDRCVWSESSDGFWESSCKYAFEFHNGTPFQNGFRFCPKCGKKIKRSND